eukprot:jgi/Hompol1/3943/HPOL_003407-RA
MAEKLVAQGNQLFEVQQSLRYYHALLAEQQSVQRSTADSAIHSSTQTPTAQSVSASASGPPASHKEQVRTSTQSQQSSQARQRAVADNTSPESLASADQQALLDLLHEELSDDDADDYNEINESHAAKDDSVLSSSDRDMLKLFAKHKDPIYRGAANVITKMDTSPYFLATLFKNIPKLTTAYARERLLFALDEISSRPFVPRVQRTTVATSTASQKDLAFKPASQIKPSHKITKLQPSVSFVDHLKASVNTETKTPTTTSTSAFESKPVSKSKLSDESVKFDDSLPNDLENIMDPLRELIQDSMKTHLSTLFDDKNLTHFTEEQITELILQVNSVIYAHLTFQSSIRNRKPHLNASTSESLTSPKSQVGVNATRHPDEEENGEDEMERDNESDMYAMAIIELLRPSIEGAFRKYIGAGIQTNRSRMESDMVFVLNSVFELDVLGAMPPKSVIRTANLQSAAKVESKNHDDVVASTDRAIVEPVDEQSLGLGGVTWRAERNKIGSLSTFTPSH